MDSKHGKLIRKKRKIKGQIQMFFRQRILGSSCARKEIVDVAILITSKNGEKSHITLK